MKLVTGVDLFGMCGLLCGGGARDERRREPGVSSWATGRDVRDDHPMGSDGWQILAALATTASAAVIAWQAWLTRRSLKTTDQALKEAERARIDAGAPTSILLGFPDVAGGPQGYILPRPNQTDPVEEMGAGTVLAMPGDGDRVLAVNTRVDIHNVGAVPAYVTTSLPVVPIWDGYLQDMPPATREVLLPAGAHWEGGSSSSTPSLLGWIGWTPSGRTPFPLLWSTTGPETRTCGSSRAH